MPLCWFIIIWGVSFTCPVLVYMGSFSYMSSAGLRVEFLLHTPCWLLFLGVSLIRSMLASLCREFLLFKRSFSFFKLTKMYVTE